MATSLGNGKENGRLQFPESFPSNFLVLEDDGASERGSPLIRAQEVMVWSRKVQVPSSYELVITRPRS